MASRLTAVWWGNIAAIECIGVRSVGGCLTDRGGAAGPRARVAFGLHRDGAGLRCRSARLQRGFRARRGGAAHRGPRLSGHRSRGRGRRPFRRGPGRQPHRRSVPAADPQGFRWRWAPFWTASRSRRFSASVSPPARASASRCCGNLDLQPSRGNRVGQRHAPLRTSVTWRSASPAQVMAARPGPNRRWCRPMTTTCSTSARRKPSLQDGTRRSPAGKTCTWRGRLLRR